MAPSEGILRGTGPCVLLRDGNPNDLILKEEVAQIMAFDPVGKEQSPQVYPNSLMGALAVIRQAFIDTGHAEEKSQYLKQKTSAPPYFPHVGIRSLQKVLDKKKPFPVWIESGSCLMENRAMSLGKEFGFHPVLIATGDEWRRPDLALSKKHSYVSNHLFPALTKLPEEEDWEQISLDQLRAWDHAPGNPSLISRKAKSLSFTTTGVSLGEFHRNLIQAIERGLSEKEALAALTTNPARICGIEKSSGTLEKGKLANLVVVEGKTYFSKGAKINSTWIEGRPFQYFFDGDEKKDPPKDENASGSEGEKRIAQFPHSERKALESPPAVLFTGFKLWTCASDEILTGHDLLVQGEDRSPCS